MRFLLSTVAAAFVAGASHASILEFDDMTCSGGLACGNSLIYDQIADDTYGDDVGVDFSWEGSSAPVGGTTPIYAWFQSYSGLEWVAYTGTGDNSSAMKISMIALSGFKVTLNSFDLGAYPNADKSTSVTITEHGSGNVLFDSGSITVLGATPSTFDDGWTSMSGIVIEFGPSAWNVGIDNLNYTTMRIDPSEVPLPAPALLLAGALAGLGVMRRKI